MSKNTNSILKEIAVSLGGAVTENDNDTNELLSIIKDNIPASGGSSTSGGTTIYKHTLTIPPKQKSGSSDYDDGCILTWLSSSPLSYTQTDAGRYGGLDSYMSNHLPEGNHSFTCTNFDSSGTEIYTGFGIFSRFGALMDSNGNRVNNGKGNNKYVCYTSSGISNGTAISSLFKGFGNATHTVIDIEKDKVLTSSGYTE